MLAGNLAWENRDVSMIVADGDRKKMESEMNMAAGGVHEWEMMAG